MASTNRASITETAICNWSEFPSTITKLLVRKIFSYFSFFFFLLDERERERERVTNPLKHEARNTFSEGRGRAEESAGSGFANFARSKIETRLLRHGGT